MKRRMDGRFQNELWKPPIFRHSIKPMKKKQRRDSESRNTIGNPVVIAHCLALQKATFSQL